MSTEGQQTDPRLESRMSQIAHKVLVLSEREGG